MDNSPFAGRYKAPLSHSELRAMWERNRSPEVRALLWEVARLQTVVKRAHQFTHCFPLYDALANTSSFNIILDALRLELEHEPCVRDDFIGQLPSHIGKRKAPRP